jgi:hypothetical protein
MGNVSAFGAWVLGEKMTDMSLRSYIGAAILSAAWMVSASDASAAFAEGTCDVTDVTAALGTSPETFGNATSCLNYSGNDKNYQVSPSAAGYENYIASDFSVAGDWKLFGATDSGPNTVTASDLQAGTWSVDPNVSSPFVVVLKASTYFAAYLFEGLSGVPGGEFSVEGTTVKTSGNGAGFADLSHISVYDTTVVPLPAAAWLLIGGLGGLGWVSRRRKAATA